MLKNRINTSLYKITEQVILESFLSLSVETKISSNFFKIYNKCIGNLSFQTINVFYNALYPYKVLIIPLGLIGTITILAIKKFYKETLISPDDYTPLTSQEANNKRSFHPENNSISNKEKNSWGYVTLIHEKSALNKRINELPLPNSESLRTIERSYRELAKYSIENFTDFKECLNEGKDNNFFNPVLMKENSEFMDHIKTLEKELKESDLSDTIIKSIHSNLYEVLQLNGKAPDEIDESDFRSAFVVFVKTAKFPNLKSLFEIKPVTHDSNHVTTNQLDPIDIPIQFSPIKWIEDIQKSGEKIVDNLDSLKPEYKPLVMKAYIKSFIRDRRLSITKEEIQYVFKNFPTDCSIIFLLFKTIPIKSFEEAYIKDSIIPILDNYIEQATREKNQDNKEFFYKFQEIIENFIKERDTPQELVNIPYISGPLCKFHPLLMESIYNNETIVLILESVDTPELLFDLFSKLLPIQQTDTKILTYAYSRNKDVMGLAFSTQNEAELIKYALNFSIIPYLEDHISSLNDSQKTTLKCLKKDEEAINKLPIELLLLFIKEHPDIPILEKRKDLQQNDIKESLIEAYKQHPRIYNSIRKYYSLDCNGDPITSV